MGISNVTAADIAPLPQPSQGGKAAVAAVVQQAESQQAAQKASPQSVPTSQQLEEAVNTVKQAVESTAANLQFSVDDESGQSIVKVVDKSTGEMIRQIPSEEMLNLAHNIERMQGLLMNDKA